MRILLINIPPWYPSQPYLSIPTLTSTLKSFGYIVKQIDLNIEFYDFLLNKEELEFVFSQKQLFERDENLYKIFSIREILINEINTAKDVLRSNDLFIKEKYEYAIKIIELSLKSYSALDNKISIYFDNVHYNFNKYDINEIQQYTNSNNLFAKFFSKFFYCFHFDYSFIGLSVTTSEQLIPALILTKYLKIKIPKIKIVFGGDLITRLKHVFSSPGLLTNYFDYCVYGYGEKAIVKLALALEGKEAIDKVPNLIFKDRVNVYINAEEKLDNVTTYPPPDFDDLPLERYFTPQIVLPYEISKGCYWGKCTFCEITGLPFFVKEYTKVIDDLVYLSGKYNSRIFTITDSAAPPAIIYKISKYFKEKNIGIYWSALVRTEDYFDNIRTKVLYEGGCRMVFIGFESGSQRIINLMEKGTLVESGERVLKNFHDANIWIHGYFMFGFPGETKEDIDKTIEFLSKNMNTFNSVGISTFILALNTPIDQNPSKYNINLETSENDALHIHRDIKNNYFSLEERFTNKLLEIRNKKQNSNFYDMYHLNELLLLKIRNNGVTNEF